MPDQTSNYVNYIAATLSLVVLVFLGNPAIALLVGAGISLAFNFTLFLNAGQIGKYALQTAIILLGFKLNIQDLWRISADYSLIVTVYVLLTICAGLALGWSLKTSTISNKLISSGTAICGGTTIACLSPIIHAPPHQTAVALALVFLLNAIALFAFPVIGDYFSLSQTQFGVWCALAIHDTSSVVATAAIYGEQAFEMATTLKLGRTLWLIPLLLTFSILEKSDKSGVQVPGFIILFILASLLGSFTDIPALLISGATLLSKALLVLALFCIGSEIKRSTFKYVKGVAIAHAVLLWLLVVPATLTMVIYLV